MIIIINRSELTENIQKLEKDKIITDNNIKGLSSIIANNLPISEKTKKLLSDPSKITAEGIPTLLNEFMNSVENMKKGVSDQLTKDYDERLEKKKQKNKELKAELQDKDSELSSIKSEMKLLKNNYEKLQKDKEKYEELYNEANRKINELQNHLRILQDEKSKIQSEFDNFKNDKVMFYENKMKEKDLQHDNAMKTLEMKFESEINSMSEKIKLSEENEAKLRKELNKLKKQSEKEDQEESLKKEELSREMTRLTSEVDKYKSSLNNEKEKVQNYKEKVRELEMKLKGYETGKNKSINKRPSMDLSTLKNMLLDEGNILRSSKSEQRGDISEAIRLDAEAAALSRRFLDKSRSVVYLYVIYLYLLLIQSTIDGGITPTSSIA